MSVKIHRNEVPTRQTTFGGIISEGGHFFEYRSELYFKPFLLSEEAIRVATGEKVPFSLSTVVNIVDVEITYTPRRG